MTRADRTRLKREYEYHRGCCEILSWVTLCNPCDDMIEDKLDKIKGRMEVILTKLKQLESLPKQ